MRAVIQRVKKASVSAEGQITGRIEQGLLVFLGIGRDDSRADIDFIADKITNLRIFEDKDGKMNLSVRDIGGGILLVSQFTLYGDCRRGRRPDFSAAGTPQMAKILYQQTIDVLRRSQLAVETGVFAAYMIVDAVNDGPVTLIIDSKKDIKKL
ncbi:MAG TPA: D-aminoacyl-tRNA deacylase [Anaerohalosphaeraceae bacterium]|nr:D-aminoacyl-tRNA deacylase [Anaerohalosphaeraceae bacterium]HOL31504.1 D-aminoacyl-tRNA deacylase [Anaerohalosphaeraceae bacterium]HPO69165.1 D-aminoacyl-tRNA deacylase [Anaerohalosphaeraceae bacterium]